MKRQVMEMGKEMNIQKLIADDGVDLDHMYSILENAGLTQYLIVKREELLDYVKENIDRNMKVAPLIKSIEDNPYAKYYRFDRSSCSNLPAVPVYDKKDMAAAIGNE